MGFFFFHPCPHNNENQIGGGNYAVEIELKLGELKYDESLTGSGCQFYTDKSYFPGSLNKRDS